MQGRRGQYDDESGDESLSDSEEEAEERRDRRARPSQRSRRSDEDDNEQPSDDSREDRLRRRDGGADLDDQFLPGEEVNHSKLPDFRCGSSQDKVDHHDSNEIS